MRLLKHLIALTILFSLSACGASSATEAPQATIIVQTAEPSTIPPTQQLGACPPFVGQAFQNTRMVCDATQRNQVCYSNTQVQPQYRNGVTSPKFDAPGDIAGLSVFTGFELRSNLNPNQWGIVLMRLQATLPDTLPGENVTVLLFGDATFSDQEAQGYYFTSGIGAVRCNDAPADGLLVQSPEGVYEITLRLNGADISLGSTAYIQAQPNDQMLINVLEGRAVVSSQGQSQVVVAGARTTVGLDASGNANTPPTLPEPYSLAENAYLPLEQLERPIEIALPWQLPSSPDTGAFSAVDAIGAVLPVLVMARPQGDSEWLAGTTTGTLILPVGTYEIEVGAPTPTRAIVEIEKDALSTLGLGFGTVRLVDGDGIPSAQPMNTFEPQGRFLTSSVIGEINLPPGNYRVEVLADATFSENVTVTQGTITTITLNKTGTLQLLDARGQLSSTLMAVTDLQGNAVASTNNGTLELPEGDYGATIYTNPVIETDIRITIGQVTRLELPNTGVVQVIDRAGQPINVVLEAQDSNNEVVGGGQGSLQLAAGTYTVLVYTAPQIRQTIRLIGGDTQTITIDLPGTVQVVNSDGQVQALLMTAYLPNGDTVASTANGTLDLQPGTYTLTVYTVPETTTQITVRSGETTNITLRDPGNLQTVDPNNRPINVGFMIYNLSGELVNSTQESSLDVQAGDYTVTLMTMPNSTQRVTIRSGEATNLQGPISGTIEIVDPTGALSTKTTNVYDLQGTLVTATTSGTIDLLPGAYRVEVATNPLTSQVVRLASNQTTQITLQPSGFLQAVNTQGQPLAIAFGVYQPRTLAFVASTTDGQIEVQQGNYVVQYTFNNQTKSQNISVKGNATSTFVVGEISR